MADRPSEWRAAVNLCIGNVVNTHVEVVAYARLVRGPYAWIVITRKKKRKNNSFPNRIRKNKELLKN